MNHNLTALIVDDEKSARETLTGILQRYFPFVSVAGYAESFESAVQLLNAASVDLVFMDIRLGNRTGFEVLRELQDFDFEVIFTTAYEDYVLQALRMAAVDYLLKPIVREELETAIVRAQSIVSARHRAEKISVLLENGRPNNQIKRIMLPHHKGFQVVGIESILYCIADGNYTSFHLNDGSSLIVSRTLGEFEPMLEPHEFFRIHFSSIVNLAQVKKYSGGRGGTVTMTDGRELQLAHRRKQDFLQRFAFTRSQNA